MSTTETHKPENPGGRDPTNRDAVGQLLGADPPAKPGDARLARLALAAMVATAWFVVGIAVMHVLRPDLDPATHAISEYALGRYGPVQTINFLGAAIASLTLALALRHGVRHPGRAGPLLLVAWAVAEVVEAFVHADGAGPATTAGAVHVMVSMLGFALGIAAMFVFARRFGQDPNWRPFRRPTQLWAAAAIAAFLLIPFFGSDGSGIGQRIFVAVLATWPLETARRLYLMAADRPPLHFNDNRTKETT